MPFTIVRQDITKMHVDAIVNAANTSLLMGGGVCGAIFRAAGAEKLQAACNKLAPIQTGSAAITPGFDLPAKYVIHAVGPVYDPKDKIQCEKLLRSAYTRSLKLAAANRCSSIAFPLISSGIFGYPKAEALDAATAAIRDFLSENDMDVYLAITNRTSIAVSEKLKNEVANYIDRHYISTDAAGQLLEAEEASFARAYAPLSNELSRPLMAAQSLADLIDHLDEPFSVRLLKLIDKKGRTDVEVYKKANIDRKLFSKIRSVKGYTPKKPTILALAIALELSLDETDELLECAGFALSHANKFDVIVEYFIISGKYDIFRINEVLFEYDQPLLGG